jgi:TolB-like protein/Flp pilus assembly protein TadD
MSVEPKEEVELETGHVLFMDVVGYSKLPVNEQKEIQRQLNQVVRSTENFLAAEAAGKLIRLPVGDGMALVFFNSHEAPVRCALEIGEAVKGSPQLKLRMGIHSDPVSTVTDVNDRTNIAGTGINIAQRVMDCGDAGHILLSKGNAADLAQYSEWERCLHDLGEVQVKHGVRVALANFFGDGFGNSKPPAKIIRAKQVRRRRHLLWLSAILLLLLCLTIGSWIWTRRAALTTAYKIGAADISEKSIAVLPFENLSEQKENTSFSDGLQDDILTRLAKIADLKVISRSSVMEYRGKRNVREIGRALQVSHVLEGSVQRSGSRLHMNTQLINTRTDAHVWVEQYDRDMNDLFAIQAEIAQKVAEHLHAKLSASEKLSVEEKPTQDLIAYDFYVRAVSIIYNVQVPAGPILDAEKALSEAVDLLNKAVARDPNFLLAYCQLAFAHDLMGDTPARLALAKAAIDSAFRLRPDSGEAHLALGWHLYWGYSDYDRARAELALAQQSLPNNPRVYYLAGRMDRSQGRWADAIRNLERACDLDPRNLPYLIYFGATYAWLHDYQQWTKIMDRIVALYPEGRPGRLFRASIEVYRRADTGPLRAEIESVVTNEPGSGEDPFVAGQRYTLALYDRDWDAAGRVAAGLSQKSSLAWGFPELGRDFWVGVVARLKGDETSARAAFMRARAQQEEEIRGHPDEVTIVSDIGLIDAGLGRKEEALNEGRRAMELAGNVKNSFTEAYVNLCFAIICAWTGERELALGQLEAVARIPGGPSYGDLRLNPIWDPLRAEPRFEKIVASLAPKDARQ